jgi:hypothetical protein
MVFFNGMLNAFKNRAQIKGFGLAKIKGKHCDFVIDLDQE